MAIYTVYLKYVNEYTKIIDYILSMENVFQILNEIQNKSMILLHV